MAMKGSSDMKSSSSAIVLSDASVPINRNIAQTIGLIIYNNVTKINGTTMYQHWTLFISMTINIFLKKHFLSMHQNDTSLGNAQTAKTIYYLLQSKICNAMWLKYLKFTISAIIVITAHKMICWLYQYRINHHLF